MPTLPRTLSRLAAAIAWAVATWVALSLPCGAQVDDLRVVNWQMRDGLPSNKITAALQARSGYIWTGTLEGLARFDGVSITRYDAARVPGMVDSSVTALCESADGAIWVGHGSGTVSRYFQGSFTFFPVVPSRKGVRIQNLTVDASGDVWLLNVQGDLVRVRDGKTLAPESGASRGIFVMGTTRAGEPWVIARGRLSILVGGQLQVVPFLPAMNEYVHGACAASDGSLWVVAGGHLWKRSDHAWSADLGAVVTGESPVFAMVELADGRVAGGTFDQGAFIMDPARARPTRVLRLSTGFPSDWIASVFEDREGGVWLASSTSGLFRISDERIRMLAPPDGLQGRAAMSVTTTPSGEIWVGTEGVGVYRYAENRWTAYAQEAGVTNPYVWSVNRDTAGRIWIGTWGSGALRFDGARFVRHVDAFSDTPVAAMAPARNGDMLVGGLRGIFRCDRGGATWLEPGTTRRLQNVRAILEEPDGTIWAGCHGEGLGRIQGRDVQLFTHRDGLSSDYVDCLHADADGALWIGTHGGGLTRLKQGRWARVTSANGLADNTIEHIEEDGLGHFWMSSKAGILRVSADELNACADGRVARVVCVTYGLADGLTTLNCSGSLQPAGARMPDGRLLFATDRGVAIVNPREVKPNRVPPSVTIDSAKAGERLLFTGGRPDAVVEIAPGASRIEFNYTALSFSAPDKILFRRQLRPIEKAPTFAGAERVAVYNYLPPGRYTFQVMASNGDGLWNEAGDALTFELQPFFWQTLWFKCFVVLVALSASGSLAWFISRHRLQRRLEALERERAIERERTRIANDMHDDLGAHLTRITMLTETAQRKLGDPVELGQGLRQIYDTARNITRSMDEIVWAVNPKHDTFESLVSYVEKFSIDFLRAAGIRCRLDMPIELPEWSPSSEVRHNLFLSLKEALNNAVRHARADTVTVSIRVEEGACIAMVEDNGSSCTGVPGRGAAADRIASGHGLESMRERMARIGGTCHIDLTPDGCIVTLSVPLPASAAADGIGHTEHPS